MGVLFPCHVSDSDTSGFTSEILQISVPTTVVNKTDRDCHGRFTEKLTFQTLLTTDQNKSWTCWRAKRSFESLS